MARVDSYSDFCQIADLLARQQRKRRRAAESEEGGEGGKQRDALEEERESEKGKGKGVYDRDRGKGGKEEGESAGEGGRARKRGRKEIKDGRVQAEREGSKRLENRPEDQIWILGRAVMFSHQVVDECVRHHLISCQCNDLNRTVQRLV